MLNIVFKTFFIKLLFLALFFIFSLAKPSLAQNRFQKRAKLELTIVRVFIKKTDIDEVVEAYELGEDLFLPLSYITNSLLDFPIAYDLKNKKAKGWFIEEKNKISLNVQKKTIKIGNKKKEIFDTNKIKIINNEIFLEKNLLSNWFNIKVVYQPLRLSIELIPNQTLPIIEKKRREQIRKKLSFKRKDKDYEKVIYKQKNFSIPNANLAFSQSYRKNTSREIYTNYSLLTGGDIAKMTMNNFISGNSVDGVNNLRVNFQKTDYENKLFGIKNLAKFEIGDVYSLNINNISGSNISRGILISNDANQHQSQFDKRDFAGNETPGWDVELYYNNTLINSIRVGDDGIYKFKDVAVYQGENNFKVISYGPRGEKKERIYDQYATDALVRKGKFRYNLQISDQNKQLFELSDNVVYQEEDLKTRFSAQVEYGVTDNLDIISSFHKGAVQNNPEITDFYQVGLRNNFKKIYYQITHSANNDNGSITDFNLNSRFKSLNFRIQSKRYNNFISESQSNADIESYDSFNLNSSFNFFNKKVLSYNFNLSKRKYLTYQANNYSFRLSSKIARFNISNQIQRMVTKYKNSINESSFGFLTLNNSYRGFYLNANMNYQIIEEDKKEIFDINSVNLNFSRSLSNNKYYLRFTYDHQIESQRNNISLSLNQRLKNLNAAITASANDDGNLSLGYNLTMGFGYDVKENNLEISPYINANTASLKLLPYIDNNYNNSYDNGDEVIQNTIFKSGARVASNNKKKFAYLTGINSKNFQNITYDSRSIDDPFLLPQKEGYNVYLEPGSLVKLEFPFIRSTEIDGTIYLKNSYGKSIKGRGIEVLLIDKNNKIVKKTKSEFDGFFLFEKVLPGKYKLTIDKKELKGSPYKILKPLAINVNDTEIIYSDYSLNLYNLP